MSGRDPVFDESVPAQSMSNLRKKIVHNLFVLSQQKYFSDEFRLTLATLHADWLPDARGTAAPEDVLAAGHRQTRMH